MVVREFKCLLIDRLGDFGAPVADVDAVKPGKAVDKFAAVLIHDIDAFAAGNHAARRIAMGEIAQVGRGVESDFTVAFDQILMQAHSVLSVR